MIWRGMEAIWMQQMHMECSESMDSFCVAKSEGSAPAGIKSFAGWSLHKPRSPRGTGT